MVYRRHREHLWTEHAINHVEEALESSGLQARVPQPPAICFVDLTGYTRLTEERGDEAAAQVAGRLVALVNDISRRRGGRPVRWLGDGGMFYFREPGTAVVAGLDLVERGPAVDLPPAHVGIHTGPVISQDGDVYGRTYPPADPRGDERQAAHSALRRWHDHSQRPYQKPERRPSGPSAPGR
jgi:adenylate cyclase